MRVAGERGAAAGADAGHERAGARVPSVSSSALEPNSAIAQRPPIWRRPSVRIQAIGPSAYS